jgi:hypothetical protein
MGLNMVTHPNMNHPNGGQLACYNALVNLTQEVNERLENTFVIPGSQAITSPLSLHAKDIVLLLLLVKSNLNLESHNIWKSSRWNLEITCKPLLRRALRAGSPQTCHKSSPSLGGAGLAGHKATPLKEGLVTKNTLLA